MITSGLNEADDTADCSGNLNSTKSTDDSAGILLKDCEMCVIK